jgi:PilZ domain
MNIDVHSLLQQLFGDAPPPPEEMEAAMARGEILVEGSLILPYLQTALLDEKVVEVQLDGLPTVYFSRLKDHPEAWANSGEEEEETSEIREGGYLAAMSHLIALPLEPGLGNLHLRNSRSILLRILTNKLAVEMITSFVEVTSVEEIPVLRLAFPRVARLVANAREYRAKVSDTLNIVLVVTLDDENGTEIEARPVDVSIRGLSLSVGKKDQRQFKLYQPYSLKLFVDDELLIRIEATVRHLSRLRKRNSIEYLCGFEYEFRNKTQTAVIESIVALVQRAHLKELAAKAEVSGFTLIP